jgi:hypothetical protein
MRKITGIVACLTLPILTTAALVCAEETKSALKDISLGFAKVDIGGGLRLRYQYQGNFNVKKYIQGRDGFTEERFRMEFNLKFMESMHMFVQLQDAHVWDLNFPVKDFYPPYSPYENPLDLRQAYFEYRNIANSPFGINIGRQTFIYGDNRVLGPGEWCNVGRYYWDVMKFLYNSSCCKADFFAARQVISNPYGFDNEAADVTVAGVYSAFKIFNPTTDLFYVLKKNKKSKFNCSTVGTRFDGNVAMLFYSGTFAYQFGGTGANDINAFGYNVKAGYLVPKLWLSEFGVEYSFASGDDNPADGTYKTFDGVLGAIDMYYGRMALFSWMNLKDYQINLDSKPTRKILTTIQYHWLKLAQSKDAWYYGNGKPQRKDGTGASGSFLGNGLVVSAKYIIDKHCNVFTGYYYFFPGEFIKRTPGYKGKSSLAFFLTEIKF